MIKIIFSSTLGVFIGVALTFSVVRSHLDSPVESLSKGENPLVLVPETPLGGADTKSLERENANLRAENSRLKKLINDGSASYRSKTAVDELRSESEYGISVENLPFEYDEASGVLTLGKEEGIYIKSEGKVIFNKSDAIAGGLKSEHSDAKATLSFNNTLEDEIYLFWVNYEGEPVFYRSLQPGESYDQRTFLTHPWVVTDSSGNRLNDLLPEYEGEIEEVLFTE